MGCAPHGVTARQAISICGSWRTNFSATLSIFHFRGVLHGQPTRRQVRAGIYAAVQLAEPMHCSATSGTAVVSSGWIEHRNSLLMPHIRSASGNCERTVFTEAKWAYVCWLPIFKIRTKPVCHCLSYAE